MSSWMEYQWKLNEKHMPFLFVDCVSSWEGTSYKKNMIQLPVLLFLVVLAEINPFFDKKHHWRDS